MVVVAIVTTVLLNALGLGLVSLSNTEATIASNYRQASQMLYAAEAAADCALADLARAPSWDSVFTGATRSTFRDTTLTPVLRTGEHVDLAALTAVLQAATDAELRRGADNPRWRLFLYQPLARVARTSRAEEYVVAWVADDASEADGNPAIDSNGIGTVRAQALGPQGAQRTVEATVVKNDVGVAVLSWREIR